MRGDTTSSLSKEPDPQHRTGTLKHKLLLWCLNVDYYNGVSWQKEPFNPCWGSGRMQFLVSKEGWMREAGKAERMFKVVKITASSALWNWGKVWIGRDFQHHPIPMPWAGTYFSIPGCSNPQMSIPDFQGWGTQSSSGRDSAKTHFSVGLDFSAGSGKWNQIHYPVFISQLPTCVYI